MAMQTPRPLGSANSEWHYTTGDHRIGDGAQRYKVRTSALLTVAVKRSVAGLPNRSAPLERRGLLGAEDDGDAGGAAGARTGSASLRLLATAACSARAACLLRTFSTAFVHPAVFAAAALSLRSICLLRSFSTALPQVLGAATRGLSIGVAVAGK
jgi:hypothetical protein